MGSKDRALSIRLSEELYAAVKAFGDDTERSVSGAATWLIRAGLHAQDMESITALRKSEEARRALGGVRGTTKKTR